MISGQSKCTSYLNMFYYLHALEFTIMKKIHLRSRSIKWFQNVLLMLDPLWSHVWFEESFSCTLQLKRKYVENQTVPWHYSKIMGKVVPIHITLKRRESFGETEGILDISNKSTKLRSLFLVSFIFDWKWQFKTWFLVGFTKCFSPGAPY